MAGRLRAVFLWALVNTSLAIQMVIMFRVLVGHREHYFPSDIPSPWLRNRSCDQRISIERPRGSYWQVSFRKFAKMHPSASQPQNGHRLIRISSRTQLKDRELWMQEGTKDFEECPQLYPWMHCEYHRNDSISDVILFHGRHIDASSVPIERDPKQKWVFYEDNPPSHTWQNDSVNDSFWSWFNITATYSLTSDVPLAQQQLRCREKPEERSARKADKVNYASGKDGRALWVADECVTQSQRERYIVELRKHMIVDVYGACGKPLCNSSSCLEELLNSTYKFILIFEKALCYEYLSSELSAILSANVIPVVLGLYDYSNMLLEGSFVEARRFETPHILAQYLEYIDQNDDVYNKYIRRKNSMECVPLQSQMFPCQLCHHLHMNVKTHKEISDVKQYWSERTHCWTPERFYTDIAPMIIGK